MIAVQLIVAHFAAVSTRPLLTYLSRRGVRLANRVLEPLVKFHRGQGAVTFKVSTLNARCRKLVFQRICARV